MRWQALASSRAEADLQMLLGQLLIDRRLAEAFAHDSRLAVADAVREGTVQRPCKEAWSLLKKAQPHSANELAVLIDSTFDSGPAPTWPARRMAS